MAVELVEIQNPNGRRGYVSASSRAAQEYPPASAGPPVDPASNVLVDPDGDNETPDHGDDNNLD